MFEDSLVESHVGVVSGCRRWTMLASIGLQVAVAGVVTTLPMLHPEALPFRHETPKVLIPLMPKLPVPVRVEQVSSASSSSSVVEASSSRPFIFSQLPGRDPAYNDAPAPVRFGSGMGEPDGLPSGIGDGHRPVVTVVPEKAPAGPIHVSTGVSQGMLLVPIRPVYPALARAAHVEGAVVVEAIISRTGTIESLHVVSGALMLQNAALDAIREARYRPFRLNGEPTEVQTTITVNFRIGG
jgi:periplasmic protein TonB